MTAPAVIDAIDLSIVIPAHNEAARLPQTLRAIASECDGRFGRLEVVVVDDGSSDDTVQLAAAAGARTLRLDGWRGVGAAVRLGVLAARGARILLCDADGAVPFSELPALLAALDAGAAVAVGSRGLRPELVEVRQPRHRILMGRAWGLAVRALLPTSVRDTQCGFKLFSRQAARRLFARSRSNSFTFHVEVLRSAEAMGLAVAELPVRWRDQPGSKIRPVRDSARMLVDLALAAWRRRGEANGHR